MTEDEAAKLAIKKWGTAAMVWRDYPAGFPPVCTVGLRVGQTLRAPRGHGATWEEAFANAAKSAGFDSAGPR